MITCRIMAVDNYNVIVLTDDLMDHLGVKEGDGLYFSKSSAGFQVMKADPEFVRQMKAAEEMSKMHHDTLSELGSDQDQTKP